MEDLFLRQRLRTANVGLDRYVHLTWTISNYCTAGDSLDVCDKPDGLESGPRPVQTLQVIGVHHLNVVSGVCVVEVSPLLPLPDSLQLRDLGHV